MEIEGMGNTTSNFLQLQFVFGLISQRMTTLDSERPIDYSTHMP
jgi:hypothetical protein